MTKVEAVGILIREGQRERLTKVGQKRTVAACKALGLDEGETAAVLIVLEYPAPSKEQREL